MRTMETVPVGCDVSAPNRIVTALVGGDDRIREAHRESVRVALNEMEKYAQARIAATHGRDDGAWVVRSSSTTAAVRGRLRRAAVHRTRLFSISPRPPTETRGRCSRRTLQDAAVRDGVTVRSCRRGCRRSYEIERGEHGHPEIKGTRGNTWRRRVRGVNKSWKNLRTGSLRAEAAQIAAHKTREAKLDLTRSRCRRSIGQCREYGHQPQRVSGSATATRC